MDMYKKRTAGKIAEIKIPKKVLTDFQEDGETMELPRRLAVADLEADCRSHLVCAPEALERERRAAIERSSEMLDDRSSASQMRESAERSVLDERREQSQSECAGDVNRAQGQQSGDGSMIRVVISKQNLAKLLAEGSIKKSSSCKALLPASALQNNRHCKMELFVSNGMTTTRSPGSPWSPRLDTIVEAPVQLTRSPVITRNCKEVDDLLQTKT